MGVIRYNGLFQLCTIFYYVLNKLLFFFSFFFIFYFYIDAAIFYNLFFLQNQTLKIGLYQTNPYSIIQFYKNKRQLTNELLERICSSFRTLTKNNIFFVLCFVIFFFCFYYYFFSKAYIQFTHFIVFITCCVGVTLPIIS